MPLLGKYLHGGDAHFLLQRHRQRDGFKTAFRWLLARLRPPAPRPWPCRGRVERHLRRVEVVPLERHLEYRRVAVAGDADVRATFWSRSLWRTFSTPSLARSRPGPSRPAGCGLQQIHMVGAQQLEAALDLAHGLVTLARADLGDQPDVLAPLAQKLADEFLALPIAVTRRRVDIVDARSSALCSASAALSSSLYMRNRLPPPNPRRDTLKPVATPKRASASRSSRRLPQPRSPPQCPPPLFPETLVVKCSSPLLLT